MHVLDEGRTIAETELPSNHQLEAQCLLGLADLYQARGRRFRALGLGPGRRSPCTRRLAHS